jgi:hypothetical protein
MGDGDDLVPILPDPDPIEGQLVERRVVVHVRPRGLEPVAVAMIRPVVLDQEIADALKVPRVLVASHSDRHAHILPVAPRTRTVRPT